MSKKVLILSAVPKAKGFTAEMLRLIKLSAPEDAEITDINLFKENIKPCTDCGLCRNDNACSIKSDSFEKITEEIKNSDAVIVLTPVYFLSFPSPLKAYCDRLQRYFSQRFIRRVKSYGFDERKKGALAVCCGASDPFAVEVVSKTTKMMFDCVNTQLCDVWSVMNTDKLKLSELETPENMDKLKIFWKNLF